MLSISCKKKNICECEIWLDQDMVDAQYAGGDYHSTESYEMGENESLQNCKSFGQSKSHSIGHKQDPPTANNNGKCKIIKK
jgi:hypothetical protein